MNAGKEYSAKGEYLDNCRAKNNLGFRKSFLKITQTLKLRCRKDSYLQVPALNIMNQSFKWGRILNNEFTILTKDTDDFNFAWVYSDAVVQVIANQ